jgi:Tfp pilus assembly protein PilO
MFGAAEIIALGGSVLVLVLVIISYVYFMVPARSNLGSARLELSRLQTLLNSSRTLAQEGVTTEAKVNDIASSLQTFESSQLIRRTEGRMDLYGELNQLIARNALRNTSGPSYSSLEPAGAKSKAATTKSASTKWQSIYPGIAISLTVEGQYPNLRRFVRDIEASRLFLIVNAVELERATDTNAAAATGSRAALVSLRIDMATYFQRADSSSEATEAAPVTH